MKSYSSREIVKMIEANGWILIRVRGSHHHFSHPKKSGILTVKHPQKNTPPAILKSIAKQSGLLFQ